MIVKRRIVDGIAVIDVTGRMTGLEAPGQMKEQVIDALAAGNRGVVLNLSGLSFVDSSFIGELVSCVLTAARSGAVLKLACAVRRVQELLLITRLGSIIEAYETEATALASFAKRAN